MAKAESLEIKYDASGKRTWTKDNNARRRYSSGLIVTQDYDGDGQRVKQSQSNVATYYVRSSALGGAVVYELKQYNDGWRKIEGFVYANGQKIAMQDLQHLYNYPSVAYFYTNPITNSQRASNSTLEAESDPMGNPIASLASI